MNKSLAIQFKGTIRITLFALGIVMAVALLSNRTLASSDETADPYSKADETWITISGRVESVGPDAFTLDYGDGSIVVEMDDGDRDADAYKLVSGDEVTVSGRIDDDFYQTTTIEAGAVFVKNIGTTFFASSVDEEDWSALTATVLSSIPKAHTVVQGKVTRVALNEFVVDTGIRELRIDTGNLSYNPLDDEGYQQIEVGDRVRVTGAIDHDFFAGRRIDAALIVELFPYPPSS